MRVCGLTQMLHLVENWEVCEKLVEFAYGSQLRVDSSHHPLLMTEPSHHSPKHRARMAEMFFETFNVPAFYLAKNPVLASYVLVLSVTKRADLHPVAPPPSFSTVVQESLLLQPWWTGTC